MKVLINIITFIVSFKVYSLCFVALLCLLCVMFDRR